MIALLRCSPPPLLYTFSSPPLRRSSRVSYSSSSHMERPGFIEFPHLSTSHRDLMVELVSTMETQLGSHLLPCSLPPDVEYFENQSGSSQGTLYIRSGHHESPVDFILGSWLHAKLPSGALNITTLIAFLNTTTDAPRFVLEFIQPTPTSLILLLDLPSRRDLILHPNYLQTFYTETQLDTHRQNLHKLPETQPYYSSSLFIRSIFSPTAILISCTTEEVGRMEEIVRDDIGSAAKEILEIWLKKCAGGGRRELGEVERKELEKRDAIVNKKTLENDLESGLPRLFGDAVAGRVMDVMQNILKT